MNFKKVSLLLVFAMLAVLAVACTAEPQIVEVTVEVEKVVEVEKEVEVEVVKEVEVEVEKIVEVEVETIVEVAGGGRGVGDAAE